MGASKGLYNPEFPKGTKVKVATLAVLEDFAKTWRYHNPLQENQFPFHDVVAVVDDVYFYHGGDELYKLNHLPGVWHEQCLEEILKESS
jgi:hypothetical protein